MLLNTFFPTTFWACLLLPAVFYLDTLLLPLFFGQRGLNGQVQIRSFKPSWMFCIGKRPPHSVRLILQINRLAQKVPLVDKAIQLVKGW